MQGRRKPPLFYKKGGISSNEEKNNSVSLTGIAFLTPAILFVVFCNVIPFIWNIVLSFQEWNGFGRAKFAGVENYAKILTDSLVWKSILNSVIYAVFSTAGGVLLGLFIATLIFRMSGKEGSIYRLILYSPAMIPTAIVGLMFVFFYNPEMGVLNNFLKLIGLESLTNIWLQNKSTALICIIFVAIWKCTGSVMMLCFASMQTIPLSLYESSELDGATFFNQMTKITYPLIKPMILLSAINTLGVQYKSYDLIFTMTQGGPGYLTTTVPIYMTKMAFSFGKFGDCAAVGVIFTVIVALSIVLTRTVLRSEEYEF